MRSSPGLANPEITAILSPQILTNAGVAQWLERHVANVNVVGSNPITRSRSAYFRADLTWFSGFWPWFVLNLWSRISDPGLGRLTSHPTARDSPPRFAAAVRRRGPPPLPTSAQGRKACWKNQQALWAQLPQVGEALGPGHCKLRASNFVPKTSASKPAVVQAGPQAAP